MELTIEQQHFIRGRLESLRTITQRRQFLEMAVEKWGADLHPEWRQWKGESALEALGHMVVLALSDRMKGIWNLHNQ